MSDTRLKMKTPTKVDRAFCETSSATTSENVRGVAVLLADAYADTIDATANVAMTSMLDAMIVRSVSIDSDVIAGTTSAAIHWSAALARNAPAMATTHIARGLIQRRSAVRLSRNFRRATTSHTPLQADDGFRDLCQKEASPTLRSDVRASILI